jgi:hypothetical protein
MASEHLPLSVHVRVDVPVALSAIPFMRAALVHG